MIQQILLIYFGSLLFSFSLVSPQLNRLIQYSIGLFTNHKTSETTARNSFRSFSLYPGTQYLDTLFARSCIIPVKTYRFGPIFIFKVFRSSFKSHLTLFLKFLAFFLKACSLVCLSNNYHNINTQISALGISERQSQSSFRCLFIFGKNEIYTFKFH